MADATEFCGKSCDHGSPCLLYADHQPPDRHESQHGCIFYDEAEIVLPKTCGAPVGGEGWEDMPCTRPEGHTGDHEWSGSATVAPAPAPTPGPDARAPEETRVYVCFHCHAEVRASDEGTVGHSCLRDEGLRRATSDHDLAPVAVEAMIRKQAIEEAATELERYGRCPDRETWTTAAAWLRGLALRSSLSGDPEAGDARMLGGAELARALARPVNTPDGPVGRIPGAPPPTEAERLNAIASGDAQLRGPLTDGDVREVLDVLRSGDAQRKGSKPLLPDTPEVRAVAKALGLEDAQREEPRPPDEETWLSCRCGAVKHLCPGTVFVTDDMKHHAHRDCWRDAASGDPEVSPAGDRITGEDILRYEERFRERLAKSRASGDPEVTK